MTPLNGIRVIDLGRHQAGPRCAQVLARLGAEVIKIERLGGEETRYHAPWVRKQSAYWVQYNSGKKSVSMDLRKEEGKTALRKLIEVSDVLVQNFRPGTIDEMGFGYDVLKKLNPRIIMVNISAYGQFGPYRDQIGYDPIGQTMSGIAMVTGQEGMPPIRAGVPIIDRTTALHSAIGTLAALFERKHFRGGADHRRLPGGLRLQPDRDPRHRLPRGRNRAQARQGRVSSQRHVPLCGRLDPDFRRRPAHVASSVRRPGETRVAGRPALHHPPRARQECCSDKRGDRSSCWPP